MSNGERLRHIKDYYAGIAMVVRSVERYLLCTQCYRFIIGRDDVPGLLPSERNWGPQWKYC